MWVLRAPEAASGRAATAEAQRPPGSFVIAGRVANRLVLSVEALRALPARTVTVTFRAGAGTQTRTFTGPRLVDVIALAGPRFDPSVRNDRLRHFVAVRAPDGYAAVFGWGEVDDEGADDEILLATSEDGRPLDAEGPRVVVPNATRGGRYVSGVTRIRVLRGA